jgi:hypothetical protein
MSGASPETVIEVPTSGSRASLGPAIGSAAFASFDRGGATERWATTPVLFEFIRGT